MASSICFRPFVWILLAVWALQATAQESDVKRIPLRALSLYTPYLDTDMQSRWWDYGGSTVIRSDQYVRLTGSHASSSGYVFSRVPLSATNWEIEVEFKITGVTSNLHGDGMAMWLTKQRNEVGPVFGMRDQFTGLGIFIDTYKNNRPGTVFPYVMAMLGDGKTPYDQPNDGKANELAGCSIRGVRNADFPTKLRVTYFKDNFLKVETIHKRENEWQECFSISNVELPAVSYLGFSAETGELADNHDIIRVEAQNLYSPTGSTNSNAAGSKEYSRAKVKPSTLGQQKKESGGSWIWFFTRIFLVVLVIAGGYIGYTAYRARRRDRF